MNPLYKSNTRITYYDLDCHGQLKLSALLRMVHIAADNNANELGVGYTQLAPLNMSFILQRFGVSASRLPAYGETVTLRTWPAAIQRGLFTRQGDMYDANGVKIMEWASLWLLFDLAARKILRPTALPVTLPTVEENGVTITPDKVILPLEWDTWGQAHSCHTHTVQYADVDTNMHMNNSIYGDIISNAIFNKEAPISGWAQAQINYLAETRLGEDITVRARRDGGNVFVRGDAPGRVSFLAQFYHIK